MPVFACNPMQQAALLVLPFLTNCNALQPITDDCERAVATQIHALPLAVPAAGIGLWPVAFQQLVARHAVNHDAWQHTGGAQRQVEGLHSLADCLFASRYNCCAWLPFNHLTARALTSRVQVSTHSSSPRSKASPLCFSDPSRQPHG